MASIEVSSRFSKSVTLTKEQVSDFAHAAGDTNPIHHDDGFAQAHGYECVTASGSHSSSLLMGLVADYFSQTGAMVGLEFQFYFKKGVLACRPHDIEWLIIKKSWKPKIGANLVELRGRLKSLTKGTVVGAKGKVLVYEAVGS